MVGQWRPAARCVLRDLEGDRGFLEFQSAPSTAAGRFPASLRGASESWLPSGLSGRQVRDAERASRRLGRRLGHSPCGRRQARSVVLEAVEDLPRALIRARIASGMTQEGLARRLGLKAQQVQRYEATEYDSASFARICRVVQALGLRMPKAVRLVRNG